MGECHQLSEVLFLDLDTIIYVLSVLVWGLWVGTRTPPVNPPRGMQTQSKGRVFDLVICTNHKHIMQKWIYVVNYPSNYSHTGL